MPRRRGKTVNKPGDNINSAVIRVLRDLRRIEKRQGDRYFNVVELNKSLWELGRALKYNFVMYL